MRVIDLAYAAGKKRQSSRTGLVHGDGPLCDTINLYDNFCYSYALLSQKRAETVLEARGLFQRLFSFQTAEGNFPIHLHDFPRCFDQFNGLRIAPLLLRALSDYGHVLGSECREKIQTSLNAIFKFYESRSLPIMWDFRFQVCKGLKVPIPLFAIQESWEYWISIQFIQMPTCDFYHEGLGMALGLNCPQDQYEPAPNLIEWMCAEAAGHFSPRLLKEHPAQLQLAALERVQLTESHTESYWLENPTKLYWKDKILHSLVLFTDGVKEGYEISLPKTFEFGRDDLLEISLFCDAHVQFKIDGLRGNVFNLGEKIQLFTPTFECSIIFSLNEGEGDFCGHVFRSNRPGQIASHNYEAFDWRIALRTLRRSADCKIKVCLSDINWY